MEADLHNQMCEACGVNPANVHLTQISEEETTVVHLCDECARERGISFSIQTDGETGPVGDVGEESRPADADIACPGCGMTLSEVRAEGRLGCGNCYRVFQAHVTELYAQSHAEQGHAGKRYRTEEPAATAVPAPEVQELRRRLLDAIYEENFELAASLRDQIHALGGQTGLHQGAL